MEVYTVRVEAGRAGFTGRVERSRNLLLPPPPPPPPPKVRPAVGPFATAAFTGKVLAFRVARPEGLATGYALTILDEQHAVLTIQEPGKVPQSAGIMLAKVK